LTAAGNPLVQVAAVKDDCIRVPYVLENVWLTYTELW